MQQPVQDRAGYHRVAEHASPLAHQTVGGDQDRTPLITPRVAQRRHKQVDLDPFLAGPDLRVAEVDLQLMPRARFKAHRRLPPCPQLSPPRLNPQLHRAQTNHNSMFAGQFLADHIGIAVVPEEPFSQPVFQSIKRRLGRCLRKRHRATGRR